MVNGGLHKVLVNLSCVYSSLALTLRRCTTCISCNLFFSQMLLYKLGRLLDQPLGLNLILTGVLSRLAQCPQPLLHMYLFGDTLNLPDLIGMHELLQFRLKRDVRTLVGVLQQVCLVAGR